MMQVILCYLLMHEVVHEPPEEGVWSMLPDDTMIITSRFICGIVLHVFMQNELNTAIEHMKFAVNHAWKFENY